MQQITKYNITLASSSPRRSKLLQQINVPFTVVKHDFLEEVSPSISAHDAPLELALSKMNQCPAPQENELIITCDTVVVINNKVIGKPKSIDEAQATLQLLSNRSHEVVSGICLKTQHHLIASNNITKVHFDCIPPQAISEYINSGSPFDKAGGYGIQDPFGMQYIKRFEGCYYNVMGLPINTLLKLLPLI